MKPINYIPLVLFILALAILLMFGRSASASTGAEYHREQAIMALGYVQDPRAYLYWRGSKEGLSSSELYQLDQIAHCESRWNPTAQNTNSTAAGVYQIIQGTWLANSPYGWERRYDYKANIDTAIKLYQRRGVQPWVCGLA